MADYYVLPTISEYKEGFSMVGERNISIGFLNVVASPHPDGIYRQSLEKIANRPVNVRGNDWAIITKPRQSRGEPGLCEGMVSVWTDVDASEPSIDKATFRQQDIEASLRKIFAQRGFNNRSFSYVLNERAHKVAIELRNEDGKSISITQASRVFDLLLSKLNRQGQTFSITVVPDEDAIEQVLGLERLDKVHILLKRPNPGDHDGGDADDVLRELAEQNLKNIAFDFARQPGSDGIHLNAKNEAIADVASENGYVTSSGLNEDGEREKRSTKEYPKIVALSIAAGAVAVAIIRAEAKRLRA